MSKNQQAQPQKPGFMQNLLLFAIIMVAVNLYMSNQRSQTPDTKTVDAILKDMRDDNAAIKDLTISKVDFPALQNKLKTEKISQDLKDQYEIQGALLVTDTGLKAGTLRNDLGRLTNAYMLLQGYENRFQGKPVWNQPVPVSPPTLGPVPEVQNLSTPNVWTGQSLFDTSVKILDQHNKDTLVWGFFPGYQMIDFLVNLTGAHSYSYWIAAVLLALVVRAIVFPLYQKQMMHSRQMMQLSPLVKEVQEKFKGDQTEIQTRTMAIYKEYGLNPMAGCFPMFIQLPLIYLVYQCMIHYRFEFQKGVFLWINPAGHAALPNLIASNLGQKDLILLALYGISMISTSLLMPVADPSNARQGRIMGVTMSGLFAVMMFFYPALPSAFVLYWTTTNLLATIQSLMIYRTPMPPLVKVNTPAGGVYPSDGALNGNGNGWAKNPFGQSGFATGPTKTGKPVKHKPKKRK
jgi:YidC/Oxa1 family membrane protein insertase